MNYGKEFKKFATKTKVNAMYYDKIVGAMNPTNMTHISLKNVS
jgi:ATP-dependent Clp protease protease subunit